MRRTLDFLRGIYFFPFRVKHEWETWKFARLWGIVPKAHSVDMANQNYLARYYENDALPAFVITRPKWWLAPHLHRLFGVAATITNHFRRTDHEREHLS